MIVTIKSIKMRFEMYFIHKIHLIFVELKNLVQFKHPHLHTFGGMFIIKCRSLPYGLKLFYFLQTIQ